MKFYSKVAKFLNFHVFIPFLFLGFMLVDVRLLFFVCFYKQTKKFFSEIAKNDILFKNCKLFKFL